MLTFNPLKENCTGCSACYSVCPKHCIEMIRDSEGFVYPELISPQLCVKCDLCAKVCPINNREIKKLDQKAFAAVSKDYSIWKRSASGGAFSEICHAWGDNDTLVVGAAWDNFYVRHIGVIGVNNITPLCNSKYVSSHIEDTFCEVKEYLKHGKVIFCGTPCQVDGLKTFLRREYDNLLTIDLICHGVGSPSVFESCIKEIEGQAGKTCKAYTFRAKRKTFEIDYMSRLTFEDSDIYVTNDQYMQLFLKQLCLRPSCGKNCKYRGRNKRPGDFTIADLKGLTKIFPSLLGSKQNYSTIITNTLKAESIISILHHKMELREVTIEQIIEYNPLFDKHTWSSDKRDIFFQEYSVDPQCAIKKWTTPFSINRRSIRKVLFDILPSFCRRIILKSIS